MQAGTEPRPKASAGDSRPPPADWSTVPTPPFPATRFPPWLAHVLRAQRGPVPWSAVLRGALAAVPLLLSVLAERPTAGVPAALGAMLAGINDRPGSRRAGR